MVVAFLAAGDILDTLPELRPRRAAAEDRSVLLPSAAFATCSCPVRRLPSSSSMNSLQILFLFYHILVNALPVDSMLYRCWYAASML